MADTPTWPSSTLLVVTPSDTVNFTKEVRQLYVGTSGDVTVRTLQGTNILFKNVIGGTYLGPFFIARVNQTGTTATDIVAFT